jgi:hypothetical protein
MISLATADCWMDMASQTFRNTLANLVASGRVSPAQIDAAVLPILESWFPGVEGGNAIVGSAAPPSGSPTCASRSLA